MTAPLTAEQQVLLTHVTLDQLGVEPGELPARLHYLRAAVLGFRFAGFAWPEGLRWRGPGLVVEEPAVSGAVVEEPAVDGPGVEAPQVETPEEPAQPADAARRAVDALLAKADAVVVVGESWEYWCPACRQLRLAPGQRPTACGVCGGSDLLVDAPGRLDEAALRAQPEAAKAEVERVKAALGAVEEPRSEAEPPLDWDEAPAGDAVDASTSTDPSVPDAEDADEHDSSWRDEKTRKGFFAALTEAGVTLDYDVIAAYCESKGAPRPSRMKAPDRERFLGSITNNVKGARERLLEWAAIHGEAVAAELRATRKAAAAERKAARAAERAAAKAAKAAGAQA